MEKVNTRNETIKVATMEAPAEAKRNRKSSGMSPAILNRIACTIAGQLPSDTNAATIVLRLARHMAGIEPEHDDNEPSPELVEKVAEYWRLLDEFDATSDDNEELYNKAAEALSNAELVLFGFHCKNIADVRIKGRYFADMARRGHSLAEELAVPLVASLAHAGEFQPIDENGPSIVSVQADSSPSGDPGVVVDTLAMFAASTGVRVENLALTIEGMSDAVFREWAAMYAAENKIEIAPAELPDLIERHDATMQLANEVRSDAIANLHIRKAEKIVGQIAAYRCENLEDIRLKASFLIRAAELEFNDGHPFFGRWGLPVLKSLTELRTGQ